MIREAIEREAESLGFSSVGICSARPLAHVDFYRSWVAAGHHAGMDYLERHIPLKADPNTVLEGVQSIIAVSLNYNQPNPVVEGMPHVARYALGRDYHKVLKSKLQAFSKALHPLLPEAQFRACVDSAPIFEREYAHMAGLGWFGKNTMLIDSRRGSWFFIGLLLTTARIEPDSPSVGGCGNCHACIEACPTGAIVFENGRWQVDARRCISYQTIEHRGPLTVDTHGWTFGCDICQEVCPFNQPRESQPLRATETTVPDFLKRTPLPSLIELTRLNEEEWDRITRGSPIRRAGRDGLRRNAQGSL